MLSITSRYNFPSKQALKHLTKRTMGTVYPTTKSTATDLLSILPEKFETAKTSGELFFFPSTSRDIHSEGRRVCPVIQLSISELMSSSIYGPARHCSTSNKLRKRHWQLKLKPLHLMLNDPAESRMMERVGNRMLKNHSSRLMSRSSMWARWRELKVKKGCLYLYVFPLIHCRIYADRTVEQSMYSHCYQGAHLLIDSTRSYQNISYSAHWPISPKPFLPPHHN
jgi:hypothetical protein